MKTEKCFYCGKRILKSYPVVTATSKFNGWESEPHRLCGKCVEDILGRNKKQEATNDKD
jgi:hypothetical protein